MSPVEGNKAPPILGKDGKPIPGMFSFSSLPPNKQIENDINAFILDQKHQNQVKEVEEEAKSPPILGGWVQVEGQPEGVLTTQKPMQDFTTPEYAQHAERMRARSDLFDYIKVIIKQRKDKKALLNKK